MNIRRAIFLDRDGVIIRDIDLLTRPDQVELLDHAAQAISTLNQADYKVIVVSNQTVIARGLASEAQVNEVNEWLRVLLLEQAGAKIDAFYICPHHPNATLPAYRIDCDCRKPFPGLLFKAAKDFDLELEHSFYDWRPHYRYYRWKESWL